MARRTFRLLKETYHLEKGALLQEGCDDGTQRYNAISGVKAIFNGATVGNIPRPAIEKQPEWFVEVFQIVPEYATKEEIKKFKAKRAKK